MINVLQNYKFAKLILVKTGLNGSITKEKIEKV